MLMQKKKHKTEIQQIAKRKKNKKVVTEIG